MYTKMSLSTCTTTHMYTSVCQYVHKSLVVHMYNNSHVHQYECMLVCYPYTYVLPLFILYSIFGLHICMCHLYFLWLKIVDHTYIKTIYVYINIRYCSIHMYIDVYTKNNSSVYRSYLMFLMIFSISFILFLSFSLHLRCICFISIICILQGGVHN